MMTHFSGTETPEDARKYKLHVKVSDIATACVHTYVSDSIKNYRSSNRMLLRLMSLHIESERGRWKNDREPRREPPPLTDRTSSKWVMGKLTLRGGFADAVDDVSSPDIPNAL